MSSEKEPAEACLRCGTDRYANYREIEGEVLCPDCLWLEAIEAPKEARTEAREAVLKEVEASIPTGSALSLRDSHYAGRLTSLIARLRKA